METTEQVVVEKRKTVMDFIREDVANRKRELAQMRAAMTAKRAVLRKIDRVAKFSKGQLHAYGYAGQLHVHVTMEVLTLKDKRLVKVIERLDDIVPFVRSSDGPEGRRFETEFSGKGNVRLVLQANVVGADENEKCRRVVKKITAGMPVVEYAYECN